VLLSLIRLQEAVSEQASAGLSRSLCWRQRVSCPVQIWKPLSSTFQVHKLFIKLA